MQHGHLCRQKPCQGQEHKTVISSQGSGPRSSSINLLPPKILKLADRQQNQSQGSSEVQPSIFLTPPQATPTIGVHLSSKAVLEAEIRWVIKVALSKYPFNSCSDMGLLFHLMFPDVSKNAHVVQQKQPI